MSEEIEQEETKLKRITIKTETGSKWFDDPEKLLAQHSLNNLLTPKQ